MNIEKNIQKKVDVAEKRISELLDNGDIKKLAESNAYEISRFYENKSHIRIETAKIILEASKKDKIYSDYSETVSAAYYSMFYMVQSYLAIMYKIKLRENLRGVHSTTANLVIYYLVKTNKLAKHLYEEYVKTLETVDSIQNLNIAYFKNEAFEFAETYDQSRDAREIFTYTTTKSAEEYHAERAIKTAEEFNNVLKQLILKGN